MKKILLILLIGLLAFSVTASEPSVVLSSLLPISLYSGSAEEERIELSEIYYSGLETVAIPVAIKNSGFEVLNLLSYNPLKFGSAVVKGTTLFTSLEDIEMIGASGSVVISPDFSYMEEGKFAMRIEYDDVSLLYRIAGVIESGEIDGDVDLIITWKTPRLLEISIISDTTLEKGAIDLYLDFDRPSVEKYLEAIGSYGLDDLREMVLYMLLAGIDEDILDQAGMSMDDIIALTEDEEVVDLFDALTFLMIVSEGGISPTEAFTLAFKTELVLDKTNRDVDLDKLIRTFVKIYNIVSYF